MLNWYEPTLKSFNQVEFREIWGFPDGDLTVMLWGVSAYQGANNR
jgi:hypothetical protein